MIESVRTILTLIFSLYILSAIAHERSKEVFVIGDADYLISEEPLTQFISRENLMESIETEVCEENTRGYRGIWELKDEVLWLSHLGRNPCGNRFVSVNPIGLFGKANYPVEAEWYSGKITLPVGQRKFLRRENTSLKEVLIYGVEAFVFNFQSGRLISKQTEIVELDYDF